MMNKKILSMLLISSCFSISSCGSITTSSEEKIDSSKEEPSKVVEESSEISEEQSISEKTEATYINVYPCQYDEVNETNDMDAFYKQTVQSSGWSHDQTLEYGFVKSVWHTLSINNEFVPVYSTRCGYGIHSFAYIDVDTDGLFSLDVKLLLTKKDFSSVVVLPEKLNVESSISNGLVKATINDYGSYSFAFDDNPYMALTIYVAKETKAPTNYEKVEISAGSYNNDNLVFTDKGKLYYFKQGVYDISHIQIPENSIAYFERGTYFRVHQWNNRNVLYAAGNNIKILGRSLFDLSDCVGGDEKTKGTFGFDGDDCYVEGITVINSHSWTMCSTGSNNFEICKCCLYGYRTYSDGIMLSDCTNGYGHDNFVRTGDDGIEVKSTSAYDQTDNILYENNCVWTDKGNAYGVIFEANHDVKNVYFKNNSVGFAQACWSEHLGCFMVQMGNRKTSTWEDIHFENGEVFKTNCSLLTLYNRAANIDAGGKIKNIYFKNITCKYVQRVNLPYYCINIVIRLSEEASYSNAIIGAAYYDNINYCGVDITKDNYQEYTNVAIDEAAKFSLSNIKINTLNSQEE